jgi:hypothetical protein
MPVLQHPDHPLPIGFCAVLLSALALSGCELLNGGTTQSTHFVFLTNCQHAQALNDCSIYPIERLDLTVGPAAQKVAWKKTQLRESSGTYVTGTNCTVISTDDFRCDELSFSKGTLVAAIYEDSWAELLGNTPVFDDHFLSWVMWYTSTASSPSSVAVGTFNLFANFAVDLVLGIAATIGVLIGWAWLSSR